ncbi:hypothetical protein BDV96DRAFT_694548 [Lophiotrema nucula]|uniref:Uncharacterized protein n=1 Tax=Lophiotrema nucula TaxID=690887 RepID=A0A6A5YFE5_9PLEO|nr:hypothetical protein BDV96DRAFT_694548 [Lophiotrema nucula]
MNPSATESRTARRRGLMDLPTEIRLKIPEYMLYYEGGITYSSGHKGNYGVTGNLRDYLYGSPSRVLKSVRSIKLDIGWLYVNDLFADLYDGEASGKDRFDAIVLMIQHLPSVKFALDVQDWKPTNWFLGVHDANAWLGVGDALELIVQDAPVPSDGSMRNWHILPPRLDNERLNVIKENLRPQDYIKALKWSEQGISIRYDWEQQKWSFRGDELRCTTEKKRDTFSSIASLCLVSRKLWNETKFILF